MLKRPYIRVLRPFRAWLTSGCRITIKEEIFDLKEWDGQIDPNSTKRLMEQDYLAIVRPRQDNG